MTITLLEHYAHAVAQGAIRESPSQRDALCVLDHINAQLLREKKRFFWPRWQRIEGLYLHGSVGVGKTYVMDLFFKHCADSHKLRLHFHHFMQLLDEKLRQLQGVRNPVERIVLDFCKLYRVICLDEFLVQEVGDAMILVQLLQGLLQRGVTLIITTNTRPDDLYRDGVQRDRFLPLIACIKKACRVMELHAPSDYRLGRVSALKAYVSPLGLAAEQHLAAYFATLGGHVVKGGELMVQQRYIPCVQHNEHAVWFEFASLCAMPRSRLDYLEIAQRFDALFLSNVPLLLPDDQTRVILFIRLVDVLYDQRVRLVMSAAGAPLELYQAGPMQQEFKRTRSRLEEMQSVDYQFK